MTRPIVLPLSQCTDLDLVGGKAVGLARLIAVDSLFLKGFVSRQRPIHSVCMRQGLLSMRSGRRSAHYQETSERRRWPAAGIESDG